MKRILAMTICIAILATAAITGSIAYFTDSDAATNVFTVGNVVIEQHEQERTNDNALRNFTNPVVGRLHPMVERAGDEKWSAMPGNESIHLRSLDHWANYVDKIVTIENKGKSEAYVRNIVAIPTGLPAGAEDVNWLEADWFDASTTTNTSTAWEIVDTLRDVDIDGALYDIYVINYKTALTPNATTTPTLLGVGLSKNVDYEETDGTGTYYYKDENGKRTNISLDPESMKIYVATQAVQAAGFDTADAAFNATFGVVSAAIFGGTGGSTGGDSTSTVVSGGKIGENSFDWNYLTNTNNKDSKGNPYVQVNDSKTLTAISPDLTELYVDGSAVKTIKISGKIRNELPDESDYPSMSVTSKLQTLVIGEGVTAIADWGCSEFENLTSITLPASLKTIGDHAFYQCTDLKTVKLADGNVNKLPSGVTSIEKAAFADCEALVALDLSGLTGVTTLSDTFCGCSLLKDVQLPINLTTIGVNTFKQCTALQKITIPEKVTSIRNEAFMGCTSLQSVTIKSTGAIEFGHSAFERCCTGGTLEIKTNNKDNITYIESGDYSTFHKTVFEFKPINPQ